MSQWTQQLISPAWATTLGTGGLKSVYVRVFDYPAGYRGNTHRHSASQVVYSYRGVASVYSDQGCWMASPLQAVTIPGWHNHRVAAEGNTLLYSLFIEPPANAEVIKQFGCLAVSSVLHALVKEAGKFFVDYDVDSVEHRLLNLIFDLLKREPVNANALYLPNINHPRIAKVLNDWRGQSLRSAEVAKQAAFSPRQFARVFKQDTGLTFKDWRARFLIQQSIKLLQEGRSVTDVANQLNFSSASAFIAVYKKLLGRTPTAAQ